MIDKFVAWVNKMYKKANEETEKISFLVWIENFFKKGSKKEEKKEENPNKDLENEETENSEEEKEEEKPRQPKIEYEVAIITANESLYEKYWEEQEKKKNKKEQADNDSSESEESQTEEENEDVKENDSDKETLIESESLDAEGIAEDEIPEIETYEECCQPEDFYPEESTEVEPPSDDIEDYEMDDFKEQEMDMDIPDDAFPEESSEVEPPSDDIEECSESAEEQIAKEEDNTPNNEEVEEKEIENEEEDEDEDVKFDKFYQSLLSDEEEVEKEKCEGVTKSDAEIYKFATLYNEIRLVWDNGEFYLHGKYTDEDKNVIEEKELPIHYGYINRRYVNGRAVIDLDKKYIIFIKKEKEKK